MKTLLLIALAAVSAAAGEISFSRLGVGEEIQIDYAAAGCFFSGTNKLKIVRADKFKAILLWSVETHAQRPLTNNIPAEIELTKEDVAALDAMRKLYATNTASACNFREQMTLVHKKGSAVLAEQTIIDRTMSAFGPNKMNMRRLISRINLAQATSSRNAPLRSKTRK